MVYLRMLRFQLLTIALLANTFYVQARRGGGGGGDYDGGSSGGGGSSDGDSGGSGPSPEEKARSDPCRMEAGHTSPVWLHRWIGTYYNGTVVSIQRFFWQEARACGYLTLKIGNFSRARS